MGVSADTGAPSELQLIATGGANFIARMTEFYDARDAAEKALAELALGQEASAALLSAKVTTDTAAKVLEDARKEAAELLDAAKKDAAIVAEFAGAVRDRVAAEALAEKTAAADWAKATIVKAKLIAANAEQRDSETRAAAEAVEKKAAEAAAAKDAADDAQTKAVAAEYRFNIMIERLQAAVTAALT